MTVGDDGPRLDAYLRLISDGDEYGAVGLVCDLLDEGAPPERVMLDVIAGAQRRVGDLWARNDWSVAREHAATAISERAVAALGIRTVPRPTRGRVTLACVEGEWHSLPLRILAEVLTLRGWRVTYLGASVPGPHLVAHLDQTTTDGVALSCAIPARLPYADAMIRACHSMGVPVIAGGRGFGPDGRHARTLGADGWAATADLAADLLDGGWPVPGPARLDLPHLADGEYSRLVRGRAGFVATAMARLDGTYGPMAHYDERQREATADDMGHILDFLAAALYVDDPGLFAEFVGWTTDVLSARGVSAKALSVGLEIYIDLLADLPRARGILAGAAGT